ANQRKFSGGIETGGRHDVVSAGLIPAQPDIGPGLVDRDVAVQPGVPGGLPPVILPQDNAAGPRIRANLAKGQDLPLILGEQRTESGLCREDRGRDGEAEYTTQSLACRDLQAVQDFTETDASEQDQQHERGVDEPVLLVRHQAVREQYGGSQNAEQGYAPRSQA